jgi:hypothetical protein
VNISLADDPWCGLPSDVSCSHPNKAFQIYQSPCSNQRAGENSLLSWDLCWAVQNSWPVGAALKQPRLRSLVSAAHNARIGALVSLSSIFGSWSCASRVAQRRPQLCFVALFSSVAATQGMLPASQDPIGWRWRPGIRSHERRASLPWHSTKKSALRPLVVKLATKVIETGPHLRGNASMPFRNKAEPPACKCG